MNPKDLPQFDNSGEPEIYRLLKIGKFSVSSENGGFAISNHEINSIEAKNPSIDLASKIADTTFTAGKVLVEKTVKAAKPYQGLLLYPAIFIGSFLVFYFTINFPSIIAQAQGMFANRSQDEQILGKDLPAYNSWIAG